MTSINLDSHVPDGPIAEKWDNHKFDVKLVNPANKRKFHILVVGSGLVPSVLSTAKRGSTQSRRHSHVPRFKFVPHTGHSPWHAASQSGFIGTAR